MALAGVFCRSLAADQPTLFEIAQQAAEIAGVEIERASNVASGEPIALRQLVEHPHFAERIGAVEIGFPQDADLARIEAVEAADCCDCLLACHAGGRVAQIVDLVN